MNMRRVLISFYNFRSYFLVALITIAFATISSDASAQTKELKIEVLAKYSGATYRVPTYDSLHTRKSDVFLYFDKKGTTYYLNPKIVWSRVGKPRNFNAKGAMKFSIKKGKVRIVPFRSKGTAGLCYGRKSCIDVRQLPKMKAFKGDRYQLKKRDKKITLKLLGY